MVKMGRQQQAGLLLLLVLFFFSVPMAMGHREGGADEDQELTRHHKEKKKDVFLLSRSRKVVKTEAGEVRMVRGYKTKGVETPMHIGFVTMEPKSLYLPQYMDSNLIIFVQEGAAKVGWISEDDLMEQELRSGDVFGIPAGSAFYMLNIHSEQKLRIICSIDVSESLGRNNPLSFFIGGGMKPTSVLAGFDNKTLTNAFNVTLSELDEILNNQDNGPIVYVSNPDETEKWASFMKLKHQERQDQDQDLEDEEEQDKTKWTLRKLLKSFIAEEVKSQKQNVQSSESYNMYEREADFQNNYGLSVAIDGNDYAPLAHSGIGIYLVNLSAGSMMAPHLNPTATEYGIVLKGSGSIQVVYPDGTTAMSADVREGDVFWVPRYFPFCQIASHSENMVLFGFTSSARKNRPKFLVGANSILKQMNGPEIATSFDVSEERFNKLINAQRESIILPSMIHETQNKKKKVENKKILHPVGAGTKKKKMEQVEPLIKSFAADMIMGFD